MCVCQSCGLKLGHPIKCACLLHGLKVRHHNCGVCYVGRSRVTTNQVCVSATDVWLCMLVVATGDLDVDDKFYNIILTKYSEMPKCSLFYIA